MPVAECTDPDGFDGDPFAQVDCIAAREMLRDELQTCLRALAGNEQRGWFGALRTQLQRLFPSIFGEEITLQRIEDMFHIIANSSDAGAYAHFPLDHQQYDRACRAYRDIAKVVQRLSSRELRAYLSKTVAMVRRAGSLEQFLSVNRREIMQAISDVKRKYGGMPFMDIEKDPESGDS